ncbi:unnamed protein product, partial [Candidula unifasciata]
HPVNTSLNVLEQLFTEWDNKNTEWDNTNTERDNKNTEWDNKNTEWDNKNTEWDNKNTELDQNYFQQLEILLVFDSSFQPIILQVSPKQFTKQLSSVSNFLLEQNILDDTATMLVSRKPTSADLLWPLYDLGVINVKGNMICDTSEVFCLKEEDVTFLLNTRREQKASKNWIRVSK